MFCAAVLAQYWMMRGENAREPITETENTLASTTIPEPAISDPSGGGFTVNPLPLPQETAALEAPNVEKLIAEIAPTNDYEKIVYGNLTKSAAALKAESGDYDAWLTVGMSLKQLEHFTDARDVFLYVSSLWPTQPVPQGNLGSLYHLYLKDFSKSEAAYKKTIELEPLNPAWYRGLYELYRYSYKTNTNAWEETLKRGITQSSSIDLIVILAGRYADLKRFEESVARYTEAIAEAEQQGNTPLVETLIGLRAAARAEIK